MKDLNTSIYTSKKGFLTCKINGIQLHSEYNPVKEAQRAIENQVQNLQTLEQVTEQATEMAPELATEQTPDLAPELAANKIANKMPNKITSKKLIILIGGGLGYESEEITKKFPQTPLLAIYFNPELYDKSTVEYKILFTSQTNILNPLRYLLRNKILINSMQDISILYWPTSLRIWESLSKECLKEVQDVLSIHFAETKTIKHFILQWIRNATFHYLYIDNWHIPIATKKNILLIAAGPSVNHYLQEIKANRKSYVLIAVSSSLYCLFAHDIYPDIIVHQDSSYYAQQYLMDFPKWYHPYIAHPLYASRSATLRSHKSIIMNTQQETEELLQIDKNTIQISSHGTVLGSALELAWKITQNKVYIIGFDLCMDASGSHCHPHFSLSSAKTQNNICAPRETEIINRYLDSTHILDIKRFGNNVRQNYSLHAYSHWFMRWKHPWVQTRTFAVTRNTEKFQHFVNMPTIESLPAFIDKGDKMKYHCTQRPSIQERMANVSTYLDQWTQIWEQINNLEKKNNADKQAINKKFLELHNTISNDEFYLLIESIKVYLNN